MAMYFQDDFWEAVKELPEQDMKDAITALVKYHFEGDDRPDNPIALAILTVSKKRIDLSKTRSAAKKGKTKGKSNENQNEIKTKSKSEETQDTASLSLSISNSLPNSKKDESKKDVAGNAEFVAEALAAFNEITGSSIAYIDYDTQCCLVRARDSGRTIDDIRAVVESKYQEWKDDKRMRRFIRPSTLFGAKFEEYLAASLGEHERNHRFDKYNIMGGDDVIVYDGYVEQH